MTTSFPNLTNDDSIYLSVMTKQPLFALARIRKRRNPRGELYIEVDS